MESIEWKVRGIALKLYTMDTVYEPAEDTRLLMESVEPGKSLLEIGCGSGAVSILSSALGSKVLATDINPEAVALTRRNAELNSVPLETRVSDLFTDVHGKFDTIVFNPPYLPTEDDVEGSEQWNGGSDGFGLVRPFLERCQDYLLPGGDVYIILSSLTDIESLINEFGNMRFEVRGSDKFQFEIIYCYRITGKEK
ncbi:MAG: methyltransferase [Candidatus Thermoplasmatota archaeon]|nr:methyltransferase [Candidatus Thermoplasmatota archaeon]